MTDIREEPTPRTRRRLLQRLRKSARAWQQRERTQDIGYGLLAAALAISFPARIPFAAGGEVAGRLKGDESITTQGLLFPFARGVKEVFSAQDVDSMMRVLAGLAFGGALVLTLAFLRGLGFRRSASVPAAIASFAAPYPWIGATSPIDYSFGLLGSSLVLWTLFKQKQTAHRGYQWRAILCAGLAYMLHVETVLIVPAVALAVARHPSYKHEASINFMAVLTVMLMSIAIGTNGKAEIARVHHLANRALAGADGPSFAALGHWATHLPLAFGVILFGLYQLLFAARSLEARRAPLWMVPWCLVAVAPILAGSPDAAPVASYLVPAGALGIADWLNRRAGGAKREQLYGYGVVAAQVALTVAAVMLRRP